MMRYSWPRNFHCTPNILNAFVGAVTSIVRWMISSVATARGARNTPLSCWATIGMNMAIGVWKYHPMTRLRKSRNTERSDGATHFKCGFVLT